MTRYELRTEEEAKSLYGDEIPSHVYFNLADLAETINANTEEVRPLVTVGKGLFSKEYNSFKRDVNFDGESEGESQLYGGLFFLDNTELTDLTFSRYMGQKGLVSLSDDGSVYNCRFMNTTLRTFENAKNIDISNCEFTETTPHCGRLQLGDGHNPDTPADDFNITVRNCIFDGLEEGIVIITKVDGGGQGNIGNNEFINCKIAIYNLYTGEQSFDGNLWAVPEPAKRQLTAEGEKIYRALLDEQEIKTIINEEGGMVSVGNPLDYSPSGRYTITNTGMQEPPPITEGAPAVTGIGMGAMALMVGLIGWKRLIKKYR